MAHLVQKSSATGIDAYTELAFVFFLNTLLPFISLFTTNVADSDCYDYCGLSVLVGLYYYYIPALIVYGFPFAYMGEYSLFGSGADTLKWWITKGARYGGFLYRVYGVIFGYLIWSDGTDYIFPFIFVIYSVLLDNAYMNLGYEAVKYIDPEWEQGDKPLIYPFDV